MKGQYPIDESCSELTFSFWYALQVRKENENFRIREKNLTFCLQEEVTSIDEEDKQTILLEIFRPYFERLIEVLISKGQFPENESIFSSEDKESFRCYRVDITDTMVKKKVISIRFDLIRHVFRCVCTTFCRIVRSKVKQIGNLDFSMIVVLCFLVLANHLQVAVEQNQSWQVEKKKFQ